MKLPTFETCQRAKELGFKQKSEFYWSQLNESEPYRLWWNSFGETASVDNGVLSDRLIAAPTLDEVLEELPPELKFKGDTYDLTLTKFEKMDGGMIYHACYFYYNQDFGEYTELDCTADTAAEAALQLWIRCKEEGLC